MQIIDEGKAKLADIDLTMQCLLMSVNAISDFEATAHFHEYIELLYGVACDVDVYINDNIFKMKSGDLIIINSMEIHRCKFNAPLNKYIVVKFTPQQIYTSEQSLFELKYMLPFILSDFSAERRIKNRILESTPVPAALHAILEEWQKKSYGYELSMRTYILQVLLWLLRYWHSKGVPLLQGYNIPPIIIKAISYISGNISTVTANNVADFCGYSYTYFSEMFKSCMHINFRDYLLKLRINESEKLLLTSEGEITDIALAVGFSTSSHYIKQFKAIKGITPAQFRIKAKKNFA